MSTEHPFFNDAGKNITYRVVTGVARVVPIMSCKTRGSGKKGERLIGFYLLNGEQREGAIEVPLNKQIAQSGLDFYICDRLDRMNCEFIDGEVREI